MTDLAIRVPRFLADNPIVGFLYDTRSGTIG